MGYYSDRTWTRFGRRRPYFLVGAALAAATLIAMPNAMTLWMAALSLWILDASLNLTMGPFRAFVADQMSAEQRSSGYLMYMFFASVGAVVGSLLPWLMAQLGVSALAASGEVSDSVKYAFYVGATLLICAVCWSAFTTREYPPEMLDKFDGPELEPPSDRSPEKMRRHAWVWLAVGFAGLLAAYLANVRAALYVLVIGSLLYGVFLLTASRLRKRKRVHDHSRRAGFHVRDHAQARARAVLLVVHVVHDLCVHDSRRREAALRDQQRRIGRRMKPRETGSACCSRPTTAWPRWRR